MIELSFENKLETLNGTNKLDIYYFSNFKSKYLVKHMINQDLPLFIQ